MLPKRALGYRIKRTKYKVNFPNLLKEQNKINYMLSKAKDLFPTENKNKTFPIHLTLQPLLLVISKQGNIFNFL